MTHTIFLTLEPLRLRIRKNEKIYNKGWTTKQKSVSHPKGESAGVYIFLLKPPGILPPSYTNEQFRSIVAYYEGTYIYLIHM